MLWLCDGGGVGVVVVGGDVGVHVVLVFGTTPMQQLVHTTN